MSLPEFDSDGNLPPGIYTVTMEEVIARFGISTTRRQIVTFSLQRIYNVARGTGSLQRLLIFGSYVTAKPVPNDVDVILIMSEEFNIALADAEVKSLLDHQQAAEVFGASVFWVRPGMLLEPMSDFIAGWQIRRDGRRRGIVEVLP